VAGALKKRIEQREKRRRRVSLRVRAHAADRHVLCVYRSARHIYAHILEPSGRMIFTVSTLSKELQEQKLTGNVQSAKVVGKLVAQKAIERGVRKVVFNRNGFLYHGRVRALAEAAREGGLEF
jgi:large subunit ribosomal protein L18